ncbi:MAG TPA: SRPBCC family protein, partial [Actinomycetota bacterium]|nr:SRPBCC family protein [Actinomycetota bacterium]
MIRETRAREDQEATEMQRTLPSSAYDCDLLFHPEEIARLGFDPSDAVEFWDLVNRRDWRICESVQQGMSPRVFRFGYY